MQINGKHYSWASTMVRINGGAVLLACTAIAYPWKVERAKVLGAGRKALGMTRGKLVCESGSITLLERGFRELSGVNGWCDTLGEIIVQYGEPGLPTVTDTVKGVRFGGADNGATEGVDALVRQVSYEFTDLLLNGKSPLDRETNG